ncbi:radical SAM/SPASM domain-containing protein [Myxococcota bacterium]
MAELLNRLRFLWAVLTKGWRLGWDFLEMTNRRFCNSPNKIIGWSRGYPSYYLLSPPALSKPAMNSLTTRIMSLYQWRKLPDVVTIAVTDACNYKCEHCSATSMREPDGSLLSTSEWKGVLRQTQELGVASIVFVGGEPLMRDDLCELVESVDRDLSQVVVFTNGCALAEKAQELRRAGVTSVIVSIDSPEAQEHDRRKGVSDAFARAVVGIKAARKQKLLTGISAVVRPEDLTNGTLVRLFDLGRELRVNQILLFDAVATGNFSERKDLQWQASELDTIIELSASYQRKRGYPGIHCYTYTKSHRGIGCAGGVSYFHIAPHGEVCPCDFNPDSVGNVRDAPLHVLWDRFARQGYDCSSLDGCRRQKAKIQVIGLDTASLEVPGRRQIQ